MKDSGHHSPSRGRWQFLLIVALFLVPLLAAVGWYALAPRSAPPPAVHGTLIDPARPLEPFSLAAAATDSAAFTLDDLRGRWTLLHVIDDRCDAGCRERLYFTRQIHTALGQDRPRVQRVALAREGGATPGLDGVLPEHPRLVVLQSGAARALRGQLPADLDAATVLLVDPLGNLMLRFDPAVGPEGILSDLEKLLKLSSVG